MNTNEDKDYSDTKIERYALIVGILFGVYIFLFMLLNDCSKL